MVLPVVFKVKMLTRGAVLFLSFVCIVFKVAVELLAVNKRGTNKKIFFDFIFAAFYLNLTTVTLRQF